MQNKTTSNPEISIVVPALDEAGNVSLLTERINKAMRDNNITYEIVFIIDRSTDNTLGEIKKLTDKYPVSYAEKRGKTGKAYSILEGVELAKHNIICMIDADLQYPPEAIPDLVKLIYDRDLDVVVTNRKQNNTGFVRHLLTFGFNLVFVRLLFGINYDTQSGLKVFKKEVLKGIKISPSPWTFDLEFIVKSLLVDYKIVSQDIIFNQRFSGNEKVRFFKTSYEIALRSLFLFAKISRKELREKYLENLKNVAKSSISNNSNNLLT
jgi:glycosyltransferase involved in cell wall biosynthesis